jgi:hypothetical protein
MRSRIVFTIALATLATASLATPSPAWAQWEGTTERAPRVGYPWGPDPTGQSYSPYIGPPDPRIWRYPMNVISETDTQIRNLTREYRAGWIGFEEYFRRKRALLME